ncbi:MAG: phospholipase, partial [Propionibacteriales bacterium]|nr:phospholipase [Propionibacteriales bacterium]
MGTSGWLDRLDEYFGDRLESLLRHHHQRRLRRCGWQGALDDDHDGSWWSARAPVRSGNRMDVLVDGAAALAAMETAIRGAQQSVHIAGWHASPDFRLTRGPDAVPLRDLLTGVAERVPVRLLLWAGPPVPAFQPTRRMVRRARDEFTRGGRVQCALDKRERTMHCHHEKIVVVDDTLAFVGGIDFTALEGDRHDDPMHP